MDVHGLPRYPYVDSCEFEIAMLPICIDAGLLYAHLRASLERDYVVEACVIILRRGLLAPLRLTRCLLLWLLSLWLRRLPLAIAGELDLRTAANQLYAFRAVILGECLDVQIGASEENLLAFGQVLSQPFGLLAP